MKSLRFLCIVVAVFLAACSNYGARWEKARAAKGDAFEGAYEGRWSSAGLKGGGGKLKCILKKSGPKEYTANFRATWHGVFASEHSAKLDVVKDGKRTGRRLLDVLPKPEQRSGSLSGAWHAIDSATNPSRWDKLSVDVVEFRGGAEIKMWIGSGSYKCDGILTGPIRSAIASPTSGGRVVCFPNRSIAPELHATYDASYDTGRFDLTKVE